MMSGGKMSDGDGLRLETKKLYSEAGCEYGKNDVVFVELYDVCVGG